MHVKRNDLNAKSRMKGDFHVRFRERLRVKFPWSTRQNAIRPLAIGRKNYLFCGNHNAAVRAAIVYSLFSSCKAHGVDVRSWLEDTLRRIPTEKAIDRKRVPDGGIPYSQTFQATAHQKGKEVARYFFRLKEISGHTYGRCYGMYETWLPFP